VAEEEEEEEEEQQRRRRRLLWLRLRLTLSAKSIHAIVLHDKPV
jgi:hypothetical protein